MKKLIIYIGIILFILTSCTESHNNNNNNNTELKIEEKKAVSKIIQGPEEIKKINWSDNIEFSFCDNRFNYDENSEIRFNQTENVKLLQSKRDDTFPFFISEYCTNETADKFIFSASDKQPYKIGRYDAKLDIFEAAEFKHFVFPYIDHFGYSRGSRNYGDISLEKYYEEYSQEKITSRGFGKKEGNSIPFVNYGVSIIGNAEVGQAYVFKFLDQKNIDYCNGGITLGGKLSVCFADVHYSYDYVNNIISEDKICSYYIDDDGNIQVLEKCFENTWEYKGYDFTFKYNGVDIYQNSKKDVSVIDINLEKSGIIFGGVRDINTEYSEEGENFITTRQRSSQKTYNLISESQSSETNRFERKKSKDILGEYSYITKNNTRFPIVAAINGQFFNANKNPTFLSFPVKSNGQILSSYVDNDKMKKTFIITDKQKAIIKKGYNSEDIENNEYEELIVGIDPSEDFGKNMKLGRNYVGINGEENIVFVVTQNKTQGEMDTIMKNYGIENYMMLDGGPSAQFSYYDNYGPGGFIHDFYGNWGVPQYNFIYTK